MRWKTTAFLAVLLAGLGTFFYVYEVRQGPAREKATVEKDRLWKGLESKEIDEILITRGTEKIQLKKSGDTWSLAAPVAGRAEPRPVEDLLASLAAARVEREIDPNPAQLADFGLAPPAAEIAFKAKGQERRLRLGGKNPTGIWVYAQAEDKPAVILVPDSILRDAQKSATDFRDRTVLAFDRAQVKGLEVKTAGGQALAVQLKGAEDWLVTAPVAVPADRGEIGSLLEKLRSAKVKEFVAEPPKTPDAFGLDQGLRLTLALGEEKDRATKTLRFGKTVPDKKAVYAQREGEEAVFLVDEALLQAIPTSPAALRDKTVFGYDRGKLVRIELESPKGKVALALESGAWRITAPVALKADETAMGELLSKARDLRAKDFPADDQKTLARFGLDQPEVRLTVWEKDAKEPKTLLLAPAKDRKDQAAAYATVTGGGGAAILLVDGKALGDLARSAQDLRDHALFTSFEARDVTRVQIQQDELTLVLERRGEEDWELVAPKKGKARGPLVGDLIWTFRGLKWRDLVAEQGWDPARYGLDRPTTSITLGGKDGKALAALAIGKRDKGEAHVRIPGQPALYVIESKGLGKIPASAEELLL